MEKLTKDDELQKVKIIAHLDEMAKAVKTLVKLSNKVLDIPEGGELSFCSLLQHKTPSKPYFQTYTGLRATAKLLGLKLVEPPFELYEGRKHRELCMRYKGVDFIEIEEA